MHSGVRAHRYPDRSPHRRERAARCETPPEIRSQQGGAGDPEARRQSEWVGAEPVRPLGRRSELGFLREASRGSALLPQAQRQAPELGQKPQLGEEREQWHQAPVPGCPARRTRPRSSSPRVGAWRTLASSSGTLARCAWTTQGCPRRCRSHLGEGHLPALVSWPVISASPMSVLRRTARAAADSTAARAASNGAWSPGSSRRMPSPARERARGARCGRQAP
jgi:hypothetical protein